MTASEVPEDQGLLADGWTFAKLTRRLKAFKYEDGSVGVVYLVMGQPGGQDLLWRLLNQEEDQRLNSNVIVLEESGKV